MLDFGYSWIREGRPIEREDSWRRPVSAWPEYFLREIWSRLGDQPGFSIGSEPCLTPLVTHKSHQLRINTDIDDSPPRFRETVFSFNKERED